MPVIEVNHVTKEFRLGQLVDFKQTLVRGLDRLRGRPAPPRSIFKALDDVDFGVEQGEVLGIIGSNGAGKSTLLKILTRITEPTRGVARTRGRVGALLEVGTGFHPELTGRENVYLNGAILGMTRQQIRQQYDAIVDFSGIERFLDTPVKRYSSGMYLRLAFAVAAHLQADIMVVDEVLAVGDADFQRKCLGKMAEVERTGRTVLFVSHNIDAILRLCPRSIWLEHGRLVAEGPTQDVVDSYLASGVRRTAVSRYTDPADPVALRSVTVLDAAGNGSALLSRDQPFSIDVEFEVSRPVPGLDLSLIVSNLRGLRVLDEAWSDTAPLDRGQPGRYRARVCIPPLLMTGEYTLGVWIGSAYESLLWQDDALQFRLEGSVRGRPERVLQLQPNWQVDVPERPAVLRG